MKVDQPTDLHGRLITTTMRAKMIGHALLAIGHSDFIAPDRDSLSALGEVAEELSDELEAITVAYLDEANDLERKLKNKSGGAR